jgi:hypothetical protein
LSNAFDATTFAEQLGKGVFDGQLHNELTKLSQEQLAQVAVLFGEARAGSKLASRIVAANHSPKRNPLHVELST